MYSKTRLLVIIVALLIVGGAGAFVWVQQSQIRSLEGAMRTLKGRLAQAQEERESLTSQLAQLENDRNALSNQLAAAKRQADEAQQTVTTLQHQQTEWNARYTALESDRQSLMTQVASATKERDQAQQQLARLQADKRELERQLQDLQQRYASASQPLPSIDQRASRPAGSPGAAARDNSAIELPPIVVHHATSATTMPLDVGTPAPMGARVVEVNERYQFIVIDQGAADGVQPGLAVEIVRSGASVARGTVKQVREHLAACDVTAARDVSAIRIGDAAFWRRN